MKNQYFGDINDYRKYGLLRELTGYGRLPCCICWMLTADDGSTDGQKRSYLQQPDRWRKYDPLLYDHLQTVVGRHEEHGVIDIEEADVLTNTLFYSSLLMDDQVEREIYLQRLARSLNESELVFFDPDNGLEVKSVRRGNANSNKYLYYDELTQIYSRGCSVLVYQHFPRVKRDVYVQQISERLSTETGCNAIVCYRTSHVAFFLLVQPRHSDHFSLAHLCLEQRWGDQFQCDVITLDGAARVAQRPVHPPITRPRSHSTPGRNRRSI